jgi:oligoribonuclease NrnB/cAMP/cGMP phosphodiesterase (DHH superfamily)
MKALIYYHEADLDGKLSGAICSMALRKKNYEVTLLGWDYHKNSKMPVNWQEMADKYDKIFIVDLSIPVFLADENWFGKVVWIDHHASAIKEFATNIRGFRIDGVSAARLCWQYFFNPDYDLLNLEDFNNRDVIEPEFVALAGEYDVFFKRGDEHHMALNFAVGHLKIEEIQDLLSIFVDDFSPTNPTSIHWNLVERGYEILSYVKKISSRCLGFRMREIPNSLFVNQTIASSLIFEEDDRARHVDYVGVFSISGEGTIKASVYRKNENAEIKAFEIAKKYGGGGHHNAAGFTMPMSMFNEVFTKA